MTQATLKLYAELYLDTRIQSVKELIETLEENGVGKSEDKLEMFKSILVELQLELKELNKLKELKERNNL